MRKFIFENCSPKAKITKYHIFSILMLSRRKFINLIFMCIYACIYIYTHVHIRNYNSILKKKVATKTSKALYAMQEKCREVVIQELFSFCGSRKYTKYLHNLILIS